MTWQTEIRSHPSASATEGSTPDLQGFWVLVEVRWTEGPRRPEQTLQLKTLKLRRTP